MKNNAIPLAIKIIDKEVLDKDNILFTFEPCEHKLEPFKPGQFCMISIPGYGESAISYASNFEPKKLQLGIKKTGNLTTAMSYKKTGDIIGYRGPFGNGFPIEKMAGKNILIITGGCGIHPFKSLVEFLIKKRKDFGHIKMLIGAKNPGNLLYKKYYPDWSKHIELNTIVDSPDPNWKGGCGIITDLLQNNLINGKNSFSILCGPPVMFKSSIDILLKSHFSPENILLSLERNMKCASGKCQHCVCGGKYVCLDGPVFTYKQVINMPGSI